MCAKGWKWVKQGEKLKMPDPECIKTYYQTTMMPKVPQLRYGFLLRHQLGGIGGGVTIKVAT